MKLEKFADEFKTNDLMLMGIGFGGAMLCGFLGSAAYNAATTTKDAEGNIVPRPAIQSGLDTVKSIAKYTAAVAAAFTLYRLWQNTVNTTLTEEELEALNGQSEEVTAQPAVAA